jgi:hypothetical protein
MAYIGIPPFGQTVRTVTTFTATASQTTFTPTGGYIVGYVDVMYNGVKLVVGDDYTATNGTTVALTVAATAGDTVEIVSYMPVSLADTYRMAEADSRFVNVTGDTMTGALNLSGGGGSSSIQVKQTRFGYSSGYSVLQLGSQTNGQTISLYVDPSTNSSGTFNGNASELLVPEQFAFIAPTASNTTFKNVMSFNDGRVTLPHQPAFSATLTRSSSSTWSSMASGTTIVFDDASTGALFNRGGHYSTSNGRFTAPVAGVYLFSFSSNINGGGAFKNIQLRINGLTQREHYNQSDTSWDLISWADVVELNANDFVTCVNASETTATLDANAFGTGTQWTFFNGYLVG